MSRSGGSVDGDEKITYENAAKEYDRLEEVLETAQAHNAPAARNSHVDCRGVAPTDDDPAREETDEAYAKAFCTSLRSAVDSLDFDQRVLLRSGFAAPK